MVEKEFQKRVQERFKRAAKHKAKMKIKKEVSKKSGAEMKVTEEDDTKKAFKSYELKNGELVEVDPSKKDSMEESSSYDEDYVPPEDSDIEDINYKYDGFADSGKEDDDDDKMQEDAEEGKEKP